MSIFQEGRLRDTGLWTIFRRNKALSFYKRKIAPKLGKEKDFTPEQFLSVYLEHQQYDTGNSPLDCEFTLRDIEDALWEREGRLLASNPSYARSKDYHFTKKGVELLRVAQRLEAETMQR